MVLMRLCQHHFNRLNGDTLKSVRRFRLPAAPLGVGRLQFDPAFHYQTTDRANSNKKDQAPEKQKPKQCRAVAVAEPPTKLSLFSGCPEVVVAD